MLRTEFAILWTKIRGHYLDRKTTDETAECYWEDLAPIDFTLALQAAQGHWQNCTWFPTIADILKRADEIRDERARKEASDRSRPPRIAAGHDAAFEAPWDAMMDKCFRRIGKPRTAGHVLDTSDRQPGQEG